MGKRIEIMELDSACPYLLCQQDGPHTHSVCKDCGAVRHGNMFCKTCQEYPETLKAQEDGREHGDSFDFRTLLRKKTTQLTKKESEEQND